MAKFFAVLLSFGLTACASRYSVVDNYQTHIAYNSTLSSKPTVIFFLIDGLESSLLKSELESNQLPNIGNYFLGAGGQIWKARTTFPSQTFPAISSLLTQSPVEDHGIVGNQMLKGSKFYNFEDIRDHKVLNHLLESQTIFSKLKSKGLRTVSLDYAFRTGSTVHTDHQDPEAGLSILSRDYAYVDNKTIDSLKYLLNETPAPQWPDFIFIHLMSVDFVSHDNGSKSPSARATLRSLDKKLEEVFNTLLHREVTGQRQVLAMLSSDHGFDIEQSKVLKLEETLHQVDPSIKVIDGGRIMGLHFPKSWTQEKRKSLVKTFTPVPEISVVALRLEHKVIIQSDSKETTLYYSDSKKCGKDRFAVRVETNPAQPTTWQCIDQLDDETNDLYYPYFINGLAHYFRSADAPDAVIVAKPGVGFNSKYHGQHGGPTENETIVPLLLRGAKLRDSKSVPPLWELLNFMIK